MTSVRGQSPQPVVASAPPPLPPPPLPPTPGLPAPASRLQYILALKGCHKDNPIAKFWGVCNQAAIDLNECLKEEKVVKRWVGQSQGWPELQSAVTCAPLAALCKLLQ